MKHWKGYYHCCLAAGIALLAGPMAQASLLDLRIIEDETELPLPCRILLRGSDGKCVVPEDRDAVTLTIGPDIWFMSAGESRMEIPEGATELRVEHGHEYRRVREMVVVDGAEVKKTVRLDRWIDMKARGYLCGENHLHVDSRILGPMLVAEGLDFGTSLTWWNGPDPRRPVPPGEGSIRMLTFAGREIPVSIYDAELEYGWGAAYIQNLPAPLPIPPDESRPNHEYLVHAVRNGALVHYQGGWSREVGLDSLLGLVHTVNVCNNNFHLHKFQPRSRYSNLLQVDGFPVYPDTEEGMMRMNTDSYYRLLNWGLRLAAGAGSATGAKQTPVGYNRTYVKIRADATLQEFHQAWKQGRNFVTNGPMLFLSAGDESRPGDTIALERGGHRVRVEVEALSNQPLKLIEVIFNGEIVGNLLGADREQIRYATDLVVHQSGWLAARCVARDTLLPDDILQAYKKEGNLTEEPSRIRFAHTSPIYISVDEKGARVRRSIEEGLRMMAAVENYALENAGEAFRTAFIEDAVAEARQILETRLAESQR